MNSLYTYRDHFSGIIWQEKDLLVAQASQFFSPPKTSWNPSWCSGSHYGIPFPPNPHPQTIIHFFCHILQKWFCRSPAQALVTNRKSPRKQQHKILGLSKTGEMIIFPSFMLWLVSSSSVLSYNRNNIHVGERLQLVAPQLFNLCKSHTYNIYSLWILYVAFWIVLHFTWPWYRVCVNNQQNLQPQFCCEHYQ